ncbi:MAG: hypothetical protein K8R53_05090, partial [Bacteroidales bacterium]|nr:hypothetical protein [Bacteroidales bacterium]
RRDDHLSLTLKCTRRQLVPRLRKVSGKIAVKVLCNKFDFKICGQSGSHVRLSKMTPKGKLWREQQPKQFA